MLPSFLGIGAQRAGTSWLYRNLAKHPDVWLTPVKELHYFDRLDETHSMYSRLRSSEWRRMAAARIVRDCLPRSRGSVSWDLRYFFAKRDDKWYASLFSAAGERTCGEITPKYSILADETVARIRRLMPQVRIIFLMRNPIERVWSHAVNDFAKYTQLKFGEIEIQQFIEFIEQDGCRLRTDYPRTIRIWERHFPSSQILYGFYDDISKNPEGLLGDIFQFLDVDPGKVPLNGAQRDRIKPKMGSRYEIPLAVRMHVAMRYIDSLRDLSARFGGHTDQWLTDAQELLDSKE